MTDESRARHRADRRPIEPFDDAMHVAGHWAGFFFDTLRAMIAALFVQKHGIYYDLADVDPWDESRNAMNYQGPHPVVAHPPCTRWCQLAGLVQARYPHYKKGEDGGMFEFALRTVRPAYGLAPPSYEGWQQTLCGGWVAHVEQGRHGHRARKATWLYAYGVRARDLPTLDWGRETATATALVSWCDEYASINHGESRPGRKPIRQRISKKAASATPLEFRDLLLGIARAASLS
jgi:hypothetical protein